VGLFLRSVLLRRALLLLSTTHIITGVLTMCSFATLVGWGRTQLPLTPSPEQTMKPPVKTWASGTW
jgi:hypothetical protein